MTAAAVCIGAVSPKADPVWPDPVPFLQTAATGDFASSGRSKVGYGTNDEALGGPFSKDDTWVFTWQEMNEAISGWKQKPLYRKRLD